MMISLLIKSYLIILLSVGIGSVLLFIVGLYFILKIFVPSQHKKAKANMSSLTMSNNIAPHDFNAIAGEDLIATQLDLARAYIETEKKLLAKKILENVVNQGNDAQQNEARNLLGLL